MAAPLDYLTVLTSTTGALATKRIRGVVSGGEPLIDAYGKGTFFRFSQIPLDSFDELAAALMQQERQPYSFLVRARPATGIDLNCARRLLHARRGKNGKDEPATLTATPRRWALLDVNSLPGSDWLDQFDEPDRTVEHVVEHLPEELHGASCWWQFTSGAGIKPGIRMRLGFWFDRPLEDWQLETWFANSPVDPAVFRAAQPIYVARPEFINYRDPVPFRSGTWTGHSDAVTPPIIERAQRSYSTGSANSGTSRGDGGSYAAYRAQLGDGFLRNGYYGPLKAAIGIFIGEAGINADIERFRKDLEQAIREAPRDPAKHDAAYVENRVADLETWIAWTLDRQKEKEGPAAEPIEPTYPAPLGSVTEARDVIDAAMERFADIALAWEPPDAGAVAAETGAGLDLNPAPETPPPPVLTLNADIGTGKTRAWRKRVVPRLLAAGVRPCWSCRGISWVMKSSPTLPPPAPQRTSFAAARPSIPRHPARRCAADLERVRDIEGALGRASTQACKSKKGQCEFFNVCGYQKQRQQQPEVWAVAHQLLFRQRPSFIELDALTIDEGFYGAALHGIETRYAIDLDELIEADRTVPNDAFATNELTEVSRRVHQVLAAHPEGRVSRGLLERAYIKDALN